MTFSEINMKTILRWRWFKVFLGEYEWYRKLYGGWWVYVHIDEPCYSTMWLDVPLYTGDKTYREPCWRGTPEFIYYEYYEY